VKNKLKHISNTIIALLIFGLCNSTFAQKEKPKNLENFDKKFVHFGFSLGLNYGNSIIKYNASSLLNDSLYVLEAVRKPGFGLGIVTDFKLGNNFNIRFIPTLSFISRGFYYRYYNKISKATTEVNKLVESTQLDFPLSLKFKSERVNNYRWYLLTGAKYSMDLASNKDVTGADIPLKFQKTDISYELGLGLDLYLNYFKFSPELKFSFGTNNMLVQDNTLYSTPINSLKTKTIYISFLFE